MIQTTPQVVPQINIKSIKVEGYEVQVPTGLSELLNSSGAWGMKQQESSFVKQYDRKVEMRDGKLVTRLTKRQEAK